MNVWAVSFQEEEFTEDLYAAGLVLVDTESQARMKRFYHRRDSYRCLLGRLLPLLLLKQHGVPPSQATFGRTASGKPFVSNPNLERTIGFNVSHDNSYVVMAFQKRHGQAHSENAPQTDSMDVTTIGVDVMKIALPRYERTLTSFVNNISDTLTPSERCTLLGNDNGSDESGDTLSLRNLYLIWTLKEAYTKAIGSGLGCDFKRIEVDVHTNQITVDGNPLLGWEFTAFKLQSRMGDEYQVAVARFTGEDGVTGHVVRQGLVDVDGNGDNWLSRYDAGDLIGRLSRE